MKVSKRFGLCRVGEISTDVGRNQGEFNRLIGQRKIEEVYAAANLIKSKIYNGFAVKLYVNEVSGCFLRWLNTA